MYGDAWAVAADGRIARVIPTDYHVEWYRNGQLIAKGPPTTYTPVKTTQADREAWYAARAAQPQAGAGLRGAGAPPPSSSPPPTSSRPALRPMTDADFPEFKPPFLEEYSGKGAIVAPNGELWVMRVVPLQEKFALADVFDAKGLLVRQVRLPPRTRVIGFGQSALFLQREDDDGLQWVQRHSMP
jgi:hypothetical protein